MPSLAPKSNATAASSLFDCLVHTANNTRFSDKSAKPQKLPFFILSQSNEWATYQEVSLHVKNMGYYLRHISQVPCVDELYMLSYSTQQTISTRGAYAEHQAYVSY